MRHNLKNFFLYFCFLYSEYIFQYCHNLLHTFLNSQKSNFNQITGETSKKCFLFLNISLLFAYFYEYNEYKDLHFPSKCLA